MKDRLTILCGDWIRQLRTLPDCSVHCCVTSPPYWGLRDYGVPGQLGLEKTPEEYVAKLVEGFREVRRVLRDDGTCWVNLGDGFESKQLIGTPWRVAFALQADGWYLRSDIIWAKPNPMPESVTDRPTKAHEYIFLLSKRANYFYDAEAVKETATAGFNGSTFTEGKTALNGDRKGIGTGPRNDTGTRNKRTVWTVPSQPYPEAHFATYPEDLIKPCILAGTSARGCCPECGAPWERVVESTKEYAAFKESERIRKNGGMRSSSLETSGLTRGSSNKSVSAASKTLGWQPTCDCFLVLECVKLVPCTVLDPFGGSGTTGQVALELGRNAVLIELNPKYIDLIRHRTNTTPSMLLA